jgi:N-acetylneuraminic acid mutarotase
MSFPLIMDAKVSFPEVPPPNPPNKFRETALGRLISTDFYNNTTEVFNLLEAKKRQIREMQKEMMRLSICDCPSPDPDRITKSKFCLMPSIRKTPVKAFYSDSPVISKLRPPSEARLPDEAEVFWSKLNPQGWKPETRQEATLTSTNNKLFLIGGVSRSINNDINVCTPATLRWEKLYPAGVEADPRFGHSASVYQDYIVVFGGGTNFNTVHKLRECLNGIKTFHPEANEWHYVKTSGTYIPTRKYHSASVVGRHLFIYGGLNQKNNLLGDCALLNLEKKTWKSIRIEGPAENAFQTSVAVLGKEQRNNESIYKVMEGEGKIKRPGIYIFGGVGSDRQAHNKMWLVKVGKRPLVWETVSTEGKGPSPRFLHSMIYYEKSNYVIIFGGRIDVSQTSTYTCFNDVYLLCMQRLLWVRVRVLGDVPPARSGHCAAALNSSMYVFGGVSNTYYCSSDLYVLELSQSNVVDMLQKEERKKQFLLDVENYKARKVKKSLSVLSKRSSRSMSRKSAKRTVFSWAVII